MKRLIDCTDDEINAMFDAKLAPILDLLTKALMKDSGIPETVSKSEAAAIIGCSETTVAKLCKAELITQAPSNSKFAKYLRESVVDYKRRQFQVA